MKTNNAAPGYIIPETSREWYEWLAEEERKTVGKYLIKPTDLIADFRRERAEVLDYGGREILELLQNANDQAAERNQRGRVLIELLPTGLIVANTGLAFSVGGVGSLQASHLSPKRRGRKQLIGNKGLGFRAILNWSKTPIILSNALSLAYCTGYARKKLEYLMSESPELEHIVREERQSEDMLILPLLPFPLYSESGYLAADLIDERARAIFGRCEELLIEGEGYDTVIGMPFDIIDGHTLASNQIDEIRPEILLFAQHLCEICFHRNGHAPVTWRREGSADEAEVLADGALLGKWQLHRKADKLPVSVLTSAPGEATDYEIVVAVPANGTGVKGPLYSYFPTDITMPLPLVCHVTLELEQNRKHAQQGSKSNEYVFGKLAEFLAEIAEGVAIQATDDPWAGCSLLIPQGDYPVDLLRVGFPEALIKSAKEKLIVPTLGGRPVAPSSARLITGADLSWLPAELFAEVVPLRDKAEEQFLSLLGVPRLDVEEIKIRIVAHKDFTFDQRVALVVGLIAQRSLQGAHTSALLLDSAGRGLGDDVQVHMSPGAGEIPKLPDWVDLRFLSEAMRTKLAERLETREVRELQQKLKNFGLKEYSLASVIQALVAEANRIGKNKPENRELYRSELLSTVFDFYDKVEPGSKRPEYPVQSQLHLSNQLHGEASANTLYFGSGFGAVGEITQALYGPWAPEKLVNVERLTKLSDDREKLKDFLLWLGVAQWPRSIKESKEDGGYLQHALMAIRYPAQFGDKVAQSTSQAKRAFVSDVQSIDGLDEILTNAEPAAIGAWLAKDVRAMEWSRSAKDNAKLQAYPDGVINPRKYQGPLPSYVRWRVATTAWLRSGDGKTLKPKDCVLGERAGEELFPRPVMPNQEILEQYGTTPREILEGWQRAGVLPGLAYLERDEIYAKLLELPQRSPDGKLARPLYQWLLNSSDNVLGGDGPNQREFLAHGKMWGRSGVEERYFPIKKMHHVDTEGLPEALLQRLNIVALRKKVGSDKVEKIFGVSAIDRKGIQHRLLEKEIAVGSSKANQDFQDEKPFLHKIRTSQSSQLTQLQVLKDLQLEVCSQLRAELNFEEIPIPYDVPVWSGFVEEHTLYIRSDPAKLMPPESLLARAIGEALATLFRVSNSGDFVEMLLCKKEDRLELLRRLIGEAAVEGIESLKAEYTSFKPVIVDEAQFPVVAAPQILPALPQETDSQDNDDSKVAPPSETTPTTPSGPLQITEELHIPIPGTVPRKLQIKTVTSSGTKPAKQHNVTDWEFCERKAMEFEEACDPARWPLPVGQIMGKEGPGCDVLSFATQEAREVFRLGPTPDLNTVVRFIEVKGRCGSVATIELKGNSLSAAEKYGNRFFLYRLFELENGVFELSTLQNPLKHKEALRPAVHVTMEHAETTQRFSLAGGCTNECKGNGK
jgi:hypothetical protein